MKQTIKTSNGRRSSWCGLGVLAFFLSLFSSYFQKSSIYCNALEAPRQFVRRRESSNKRKRREVEANTKPGFYQGTTISAGSEELTCSTRLEQCQATNKDDSAFEIVLNILQKGTISDEEKQKLMTKGSMVNSFLRSLAESPSITNEAGRDLAEPVSTTTSDSGENDNSEEILALKQAVLSIVQHHLKGREIDQQDEGDTFKDPLKLDDESLSKLLAMIDFTTVQSQGLLEEVRMIFSPTAESETVRAMRAVLKMFLFSVRVLRFGLRVLRWSTGMEEPKPGEDTTFDGYDESLYNSLESDELITDLTVEVKGLLSDLKSWVQMQETDVYSEDPLVGMISSGVTLTGAYYLPLATGTIVLLRKINQSLFPNLKARSQSFETQNAIPEANVDFLVSLLSGISVVITSSFLGGLLGAAVLAREVVGMLFPELIPNPPSKGAYVRVSSNLNILKSPLASILFSFSNLVYASREMSFKLFPSLIPTSDGEESETEFTGSDFVLLMSKLQDLLIFVTEEATDGDQNVVDTVRLMEYLQEPGGEVYALTKDDPFDEVSCNMELFACETGQVMTPIIANSDFLSTP